MTKIRNALEHKDAETLFQSVLTDMTAIKVALDSAKTLTDELRADHATFKTVIDELKTTLNTVLSGLGGDYLDNLASLAIAADTVGVAHLAIEFHINGAEYAIDGGDLVMAGDNIPTLKYGAFAFEVGVNGTVDIVPATANGTGYTSSVLALAGLPAVAADHTRLGTLVVQNGSAGNFEPGVTALNATDITSTFANAVPFSGVLPSAVGSSTPATITAPAQTAVGDLETEY